MHTSYLKLSQQAKKGDARARHELGETYQKGIGVPKDLQQAARWYRLAAEQGYTLAQVQLASMYLRGEGVPKQAERAAEWYEKAAEKGHLESANQIACMYVEGKGVDQNFETAMLWFKKAGNDFSDNGITEYFKKAAEDRDSAQAYYSLATLIENGSLKGSAADVHQLLQQAAGKGNTSAMLKLALSLKSVKHDPDSKKRSQDYLKMAHEFGDEQAEWEMLITTFEENPSAETFSAVLQGAQSGHSRSQLVVAQTLLEGRLFQPDREAAIELLRRAAQVLPEARRILGKALSESLDDQEVSEGIAWLKGAAINGAGDLEAVYLLGTANCLTAPEREDWLRKAAAHKHPEAQYRLAHETSGDQALEWLDKAASCGHTQAQFELARHLMHTTTKGEKLRQLLESAAQAGHGEACFHLGEFYVNDQYVQRDLNIAAVWLLAASDLGIAEASYRLAKLCTNPAMPELALDARALLERAAEQNHAIAQHELGCELIASNDMRGLNLVQNAAKRGLLESSIFLCSYYRSIDQPLQALPYLRHAAEGGDPESCFALAQLILENFDVPEAIQISEAVRFLESAIEHNHGEAAYQLAVLIARGKGIERKLDRAAQLFELAADCGVIEGQYRYGVMLLTGVGCEANEVRAKQLLSLAAAKGHLDAIVALANILQSSGDPVDRTDARELFFAAAAAGNISAICTLAESTMETAVVSSQGPFWSSSLILAVRCGDPDATRTLDKLLQTAPEDYKNIQNALFWYQQGVDENHPDGLFLMSKCLLLGNGIACDMEEAHRCCRLAAEMNHGGAQLQLADMYYFGEGLEQDFSLAAHWYQRAADSDNSTAQFNLASMLSIGDGVERDLDKSIDLYRAAGNKGHGYAQLELASLLLEKSDRTARDIKEAVAWLECAAELGIPEATYRLAQWYRSTGNLEEHEKAFVALEEATANSHLLSQIAFAEMLIELGNSDKALQLLRAAWDSGCIDAAISLGEYFLRAVNPPDPTAALGWYKKAAEAGSGQAQLTLALMYLNGLGTDEEPYQAARWLEQAAQQGIVEACYLFGLAYAEGIGKPKDDSRAVVWFKNAAEGGHTEACVLLAKAYFQGTGLDANASEALEWCQKAANDGHQEARQLLGEWQSSKTT